jgi:hypothetical protein
VRADVVIYSAVRVYEASMRVDFRTHRSLPRTPHPTEGPDAGGTTHIRRREQPPPLGRFALEY